MKLIRAINQLRQQGKAILTLGSSVDETQARWKPEPESWSILEVLNHLLDEEKFDFRLHLKHILNTPTAPWPEIDPQKWVLERAYNQRQLDQTLSSFKSEREKSIEWLNTLGDSNWEAAVSFEWGTLTAGDMLASWLTHDLLHLRQLVDLRYQLTALESQPFDAAYAGQW